MIFTNSPLVEFTRISPNRNSPRKHSIDTLCIHTTAGNISIETLGSIFSTKERGASSNYGIDSKGKIGMYCEEKDRSWCTSSASVDNRAVTIEVASLTNKEPYECSEAAMKSLIRLCADICKRNNIKKLLWRADPNLIGQTDKQNLVVHRWTRKDKSCLPIDTELLTEKGWKYLATLSENDKVASVNKENLDITFSPILDIVPIRKEEVIKVFGVEVTRDHNMLYCNGHREFRNAEAVKLLDGNKYSIPTAGYYKADGLDLNSQELDLIILILTSGTKIMNQSDFRGIRFIIPNRNNMILPIIKEFALDEDYVVNENIIDVFDSNIKKYYHEYIEGENLWKLMNLDRIQVSHLFYTLSHYPNTFSEKMKDLISAIAVLNGAGVIKNEDGIDFLTEPILRTGVSRKEGVLTDVSCVTVDSGYILIRQNGNTFVVGNCPGEYLYNKHYYIANEVNKLLGSYDEKDNVPRSTTQGSIPKNLSSTTATTSSPNEKLIWDFLKDKGLNDYAVAGVMGNLFAESGLNPINLQNSFERKLNYTDSSYTKAVDEGSYTNFIKDAAGYGLAQWTYWTRKKNLLEFAKVRNSSIGDLNMQLNFLWQEFNNNGRLLTLLKSATSVRMASDFMLKIFERPADMSEKVQEKRAFYGMKYYEKFAKAEAVIPEKKDTSIEIPKAEDKVEDNVEDNVPVVSEDIKVEIPTEKKVDTKKSPNRLVEMIIKFIMEVFRTILNLLNRKSKPQPATVIDIALGPNKKPEVVKTPKKTGGPFNGYERPIDLPAPPPPPIPSKVEEKVDIVEAKEEKFEEYKVKIVRSVNYRSGPGTKYKILGLLKPGEVYTISGEEMNGPTKWGKLQSGAGWVSLSFTKRI